MGAAKANNNRDTYRATAVTLIVFGILYLVDKLIHFSSIGLPWVMNKDNFLLYTAVIFLIFKRDKSVGLVLIGLWLILNFGLITALLGTITSAAGLLGVHRTPDADQHGVAAIPGTGTALRVHGFRCRLLSGWAPVWVWRSRSDSGSWPPV